MLRTALVAAVALLDATPAQACSGDFACLSGRIVTDVPANAPGLGGLFGTDQQDQPDAGPVVFSTDGGLVAYQSLATARQTVNGSIGLKPNVALAPGERYVLRSWCALGPNDQLFTVTPPQPLPTTSGSISVAAAGREVRELGGASTASTGSARGRCARRFRRIAEQPSLLPRRSSASTAGWAAPLLLLPVLLGKGFAR